MPLNDAELIDGFLAGKRSSMDQIMQIIDSAISYWSSRLGYQVEDVKSDVLYKLYNSLQRNEFHSESSLKTYISGIVCHTCIDLLRFNKRFVETEIDDLDIPASFLNAEQELEKKQALRLAFRVYRLLPKQCRQIWRMYLKNGLKCIEMGKILGKSEGNIRRQLWACREMAKKLKDKILKRDKLL
jgi:RNA polymerase sigma-70 factor (ECF subfamily)